MSKRTRGGTDDRRKRQVSHSVRCKRDRRAERMMVKARTYAAANFRGTVDSLHAAIIAACPAGVRIAGFFEDSDRWILTIALGSRRHPETRATALAAYQAAHERMPAYVQLAVRSGKRVRAGRDVPLVY